MNHSRNRSDSSASSTNQTCADSECHIHTHDRPRHPYKCQICSWQSSEEVYDLVTRCEESGERTVLPIDDSPTMIGGISVDSRYSGKCPCSQSIPSNCEHFLLINWIFHFKPISQVRLTRTVYPRSLIFCSACLLSLTLIQAQHFYATPDQHAPCGWMNRSMNFYILAPHLDRRLPETRSQWWFSISWLSVCLSVTYDFKFYPRRSLEDN